MLSIYSCSAEFTSAVDSRFIEAFDFALHRVTGKSSPTWKTGPMFWKTGPDQLEKLPTFENQVCFVKNGPAQLEKTAVPRILPNTTNTTQYHEYHGVYLGGRLEIYRTWAFDFALHRQVQSYLKNRAIVLKNWAGSTWKAAYFWKPGLFCKKQAGSTWKNSRSLNTTQYHEYYPIPRIPRSLPRR